LEEKKPSQKGEEMQAQLCRKKKSGKGEEASLGLIAPRIRIPEKEIDIGTKKKEKNPPNN